LYSEVVQGLLGPMVVMIPFLLGEASLSLSFW
jgi:hypothetical protein